jgi:crossover junction endodeoxyribonuclease RuvC
VAVRVLGVDPGTVATGWGVVEEIDRRLTYVAGGVIRARGSLAQRLARVHEQTQQLLSNFAPACISLEKTFVGDNVQSAFRLGEARGAILVAAAHAGIAVQEYSPAEIKVAVAGNGRAAKEQMQLMVCRLLGLTGAVASDEADALGAAICHLHTHTFTAQISNQRSRQKGRRRLVPSRSGDCRFSPAGALRDAARRKRLLRAGGPDGPVQRLFPLTLRRSLLLGPSRRVWFPLVHILRERGRVRG